MSKSFWAGSIALALLSAAVARADGGPELKVGPVRVKVGRNPVQVEVQPHAVEAGPVQVHLGPVKLGEYWLGVECYPVRDPLRAQLDLPEGQGLVVGHVVPESPAAKAGIKRHDVLLTAGKRPLAKVQDLVDAIEQSKEGKLPIELVRGGKRQKLTATPAKRPEDARPKGPIPWGKGGEWDEVQKWFERAVPGWDWAEGKGPKRPWRFRFFHPGMILPPGAAVRPPLPGNMTVTITKHGDNPAKVVVKRDDQKWEVSEEELEKLPEDVRKHVELMLAPMLHGGWGDLRVFEPGPEWPHPPEFTPKHITPQPPEGRLEKRLERRIDELNERIEKLRESIEQLRAQRPRRKARKPDPDKV